jgi:uncharacterized protein YqeY
MNASSGYYPIMNSLHADDPAVTSLRSRLGQDLRAAMKARDADAASAIRSLISRLDNASAVPLTREHGAVSGRAGDVTRNFLSWDAAHALLADEARLHRAAADTYADLHQQEQAQRLLCQLRVIERYLDADLG